MNVLIVVDVYGWAFHFAAVGIKKYSNHFCTVKRWTDVTESDVNNSDVAFFFNDTCYAALSENFRHAFKIAKDNKQIKFCVGIRGEQTAQDRVIEGWNIGCVNSKIYDALNTKNVPNIFLTHNGVDTDIFKYIERPKDRFNLGWAGNPNQELKRYYLLERLNYSVRTITNWGPEYFKKDRDRTEMVVFYTDTDAYVFTSIHEGMPQTVLESAATGLPVISTAVGGIPDLIDQMWLVDSSPEETVIEQLNAKLKILESDIYTKLKVGKSNSDKIKQFWSWEKIAPEYDRMFEG